MTAYADLLPGDPAPWFVQRSAANPAYVFNSTAGRYVVLCFFGSAADPAGREALEAARAQPRFFDDRTASFFGVSFDPEDERQGRVQNSYPGFRHFWDFDGLIGRLYGVLPSDEAAGGQAPGGQGTAEPPRRRWVVLDPMLRVLAIFPFGADGGGTRRLLELIGRLPPPGWLAGFEVQAPVLVLPGVFEPGFCRTLIDAYESQGGEESGFMRDVDGRTVAVHDHAHKRRRDHIITDTALIEATRARIRRRIAPMIERAHQFRVTRMERYIVACYDADDAAHFAPHRDNTTKGTAHRRFAVSVNLNDDFDGGEVSFPEFGPRSYKPPVGGAVVFSCSLLHAVSRVTRGRRYAFLPFLYDEEAARVREENARFLEAQRAGYRSGLERRPGAG